MEEKLLTREDLAKRWQVCIAQVDNMIKLNGIPKVRLSKNTVRFRITDIRKAEQWDPADVKQMDAFRLYRELKLLQQENERLRKILHDVAGPVLAYVNDSAVQA